MIRAAARRYGVPAWILYGVWGIESTFGQNPAAQSPNSASAEGDFQFIPSTAAAYNVDVNDFVSSAFGAAHYLSDMKRDRGSWSEAIVGYGGGYTLADVASMARKTPASAKFADLKLPGPIPDVPLPGPDFGLPGLGGGVPSIPGLGDLGGLAGIFAPFPQTLFLTSGFLSLLLSVEFWIRAGESIAGMVLIHMGLKGLTGQGVPGAEAGIKAGKTAGEAAVAAALVVPK